MNTSNKYKLLSIIIIIILAVLLYIDNITLICVYSILVISTFLIIKKQGKMPNYKYSSIYFFGTILCTISGTRYSDTRNIYWLICFLLLAILMALTQTEKN